MCLFVDLQYKWNELRNGRLAMMGFLGFAAQYAATGKGPIDNLIGERGGGGAGLCLRLPVLRAASAARRSACLRRRQSRGSGQAASHGMPPAFATCMRAGHDAAPAERHANLFLCTHPLFAADHVSDPTRVNFVTNGVSVPFIQ